MVQRRRHGKPISAFKKWLGSLGLHSVIADPAIRAVPPKNDEKVSRDRVCPWGLAPVSGTHRKLPPCLSYSLGRLLRPAVSPSSHSRPAQLYLPKRLAPRVQ
ncbi:hypothetical protein B296_00058008 [Ensete ventricosum]|uniref:Uncharacterized protein n=1 Tax=Ensete ventricosum TaxID=4639 RepID=A0A426WXK3_ENSVE|nr:hypothetical protein B296_00058008 [Ensete ventricosum]